MLKNGFLTFKCMILYKYYDASDKNNISNILNNELYFSEIRKFQDEEDMSYCYYDMFSGTRVYSLRDKLRIRASCFCAVFSIDMWESYANNGNGFCLEYEMNDVLKVATEIMKMEYMDADKIERIKQNADVIFKKNKFKGDVCLKTLLYCMRLKDKEKYAHEKELRAFSFNKTENVIPVKIHIGYKVNEYTKRQIIKHCLECGIDFDFFASFDNCIRM